MDSKNSQLIYETFSHMMVNSFYDFLLKVEKSEMSAIDCPFMKKLEDISQILQNIFRKSNSSTPIIHPAKKISTREESIPYKIKNNERISTNEDEERKTIDGGHTDDIFKSNSSTPFIYPVKKVSMRKESIPYKIKNNQRISTNENKGRKTIDGGHTDDIFERMKIYISRDIEGSDDSDCEIKSVPVSSADLFKTDYSEDCFMTEEKKENEVSYPDISSSLHKPMNTSTSVEDDPYIRLINQEKYGDPNDQEYPHIVKIIDDVFKCEICLINNLPKNNVSTHVNGRQHKNALLKRDGSELKFKEVFENSKVIPKIKDLSSPVIPPVYECTLCKTEINCKENALQHINGKQHNRKLESARVNV